MKRILIISIIINCLAWMGGGNAAWAQTLPSSGTWGTTTVSSQTVNLDGDVTITGQITIPKDVTLTINGNGQTITPYTLVNPKDENDKNIQGPVSFQVLGKLVMTGTSANPIVIDGGNGTNGQITVGNQYNGGREAVVGAGTDFTKSGIVINVVDDAVVDLDYIKAVNLYANGYSEVGSLVNVKTHSADNKNRSKVTMDYVAVDNCYNNNGAGVILSAGQTVKNDIVMNNCTITNCMSKANMTGTNYGGVIKGSGSTDCNLTMNDCTMSYCWGSGWGGAILWASNIGGCKAVLNNCIFSHNYARYLGGALSTEAVMELTGCLISDNTAGFGGGGIAAFPFTLTEASTSTQAVGLVLHTGNTITQNRTLWATNKNAATSGDPLFNALYKVNGVLQSMGSDKQVDYGFNPRYTIAGATDVYYPSGGGGIWVLMNKDLWSCELEIGEGNTISGNHSAYDGGGVFLYKQRPYTKTSAADVKFIEDYNKQYTHKYDDGTEITKDYPNSGLTSMTLHSNITGNTSARSGGGAAVGSDVTKIAETWTFPNVTVTGGDISNNIALNGNGGGIYMPGGIFTIWNGTITNNQAQINGELSYTAEALSEDTGNGGGISIANGTFTIKNTDFVISGNKASRYGGGLFVNKAKDDVTFSGGTFQENLARAGGGMAFEGEASSQHQLFMKASLINNQAINGGGIYLNNYAKMVFQGGMIRKNLASATIPSNGFEYTTLTDKTAYHKHVSEVKGVGGGLFMDDHTSLTFDIEGNNLGLYNNRATAAADDIFANGNGTSVTLPDVSSMNLANWEGAAGRLFWAEDYYSFHQNEAFEHDAMYATDGINKATFSDPAGNLRYQFALGQLRRNHIQEVSPMEYTNYVCLVLGYEIFYVNIIKEGLKNGESAMFNIYQVGANDTAIPANAKLYLTTLLTGGEEKDGKVYRTVALPAGHWGVRENDWSYTYQPKEGSGMEEVREIEKDDDINSPNDEDKGFLFKNEEKTAKTSLLHHEDKVKNIMGKKQE